MLNNISRLCSKWLNPTLLPAGPPIRRLESAIGVKLLNRTSRKVSTTEYGEKLLEALRPGLRMIRSRIEELRQLDNVPKGLIRIAACKPVVRTLLWPKISQLITDYPEIQIELSLENRLIDLTEGRFDAEVRLKQFVESDMIAVQVGPPIRMAAVASSEYLRRHKAPYHPSDLDHHNCLALRFNTHVPVCDWKFEKDGVELIKKVSGSFIFNESDLCIDAARSSHGIAFVSEAEVADDIERGALQRVLEDWCPYQDGYYLCYSGYGNNSLAFRLLIDRLRYSDEF